MIASHAEGNSSSGGFVPLNHLVAYEASKEEEAAVALAKVKSSYANDNRAYLSVKAGETVHLFKEVTDYPGWAEGLKKYLVDSLLIDNLCVQRAKTGDADWFRWCRSSRFRLKIRLCRLLCCCFRMKR